jgi:iron complex transport system permease protein
MENLRTTEPTAGQGVRIRRSGRVRSRTRRGTGLAALLAVLVLILLSSVLFGSKTIALTSVLNAFLHYRGSTNDIIVRSLRIPRTLLGLAIGMSLGPAVRYESTAAGPAPGWLVTMSVIVAPVTFSD